MDASIIANAAIVHCITLQDVRNARYSMKKFIKFLKSKGYTDDEIDEILADESEVDWM